MNPPVQQPSASDPLYLEAIATFREKYARVTELGLREPHAMSLATVGANGQPSVRTVLMRVFDERGFVFFTNSLSRKGRQMNENPQVGLCFYWDHWAEQIHIEGRIERVDDDETDHYWARRARLSRIGAWASQQSQPLAGREVMMDRVAELERQYEGRDDIPRPPHWFGYRVVPSRIEFWVGRDGRLHERTVYEQTPDGWTRGMLFP